MTSQTIKSPNMTAKFLLFIFSIFIILLLVGGVKNTATKGKAGPYHSSLESIRRCVNLKMPFEKESSGQAYMETYKNDNGLMLLRGNISIFKETSQWKGKAKQFTWVNGKWKSSIVLHSSRCQGIFNTILVTLIGVEYDFQHCTFKPGTYIIKDLDVNKVGHLWTPTMMYGKEMWRVEVSTPAGLVDCWEFFNVIEPL